MCRAYFFTEKILWQQRNGGRQSWRLSKCTSSYGGAVGCLDLRNDLKGRNRDKATEIVRDVKRMWDFDDFKNY